MKVSHDPVSRLNRHRICFSPHAPLDSGRWHASPATSANQGHLPSVIGHIPGQGHRERRSAVSGDAIWSAKPDGHEPITPGFRRSEAYGMSQLVLPRNLFVLRKKSAMCRTQTSVVASSDLSLWLTWNVAADAISLRIRLSPTSFSTSRVFSEHKKL